MELTSKKNQEDLIAVVREQLKLMPKSAFFGVSSKIDPQNVSQMVTTVLKKFSKS